MRSLNVDYIRGRSEVRQGGYLLRWADSTNEYHTHIQTNTTHTAQADERRESGERKGEKEFRESSQSFLGKDEPRSAPRSCRQAKPPRNGN